jgi:hypothetical protein
VNSQSLVRLRFEGGPLDGQTLEMQLAIAGLELVLERGEEKVVYAFEHWDTTGVAVYRFIASKPRGHGP